MKKFNQVLYGWFDDRSKKDQRQNPHKLMFDGTATVIYDNWHWRIKQGYQGDPLVPTHTNFHYLRKIHPQAKIVGELIMLSSDCTLIGRADSSSLISNICSDDEKSSEESLVILQPRY